MTLSAISFNFGIEALTAIARILILLLAMVVHEWAHAYSAVRCGDPTPRYYGRLTLNPIKHFDPIGTVMLLVAQVGYAKPVPVNPSNFRHPRRDYVWVSLAGVTSNFIQSFIFTGALTAVYTFGYDFYVSAMTMSNAGAYFLVSLLQFGVIINIALMVFNLFPIYPLDGFRLVEANTRRNNRYCTFMYRYGMYVMLGLVVWSLLIQLLVRVTGASFLQYFDILGWLMSTISYYINWPINWCWSQLWGLFV